MGGDSPPHFESLAGNKLRARLEILTSLDLIFDQNQQAWSNFFSLNKLGAKLSERQKCAYPASRRLVLGFFGSLKHKFGHIFAFL